MIWCLFQNNMPVFCPALTDGAIGDELFVFSAENPGLKLDIVEGKRVHLCLLNLSLWFKLVLHNAVDSRYFKVEQPRNCCQQHRDDHPGRRCSQTPSMQCQFLGKYSAFFNLMLSQAKDMFCTCGYFLSKGCEEMLFLKKSFRAEHFGINYFDIQRYVWYLTKRDAHFFGRYQFLQMSSNQSDQCSWWIPCRNCLGNKTTSSKDQLSM